jgi:hypothetical protein
MFIVGVLSLYATTPKATPITTLRNRPVYRLATPRCEPSARLSRRIC